MNDEIFEVCYAVPYNYPIEMMAKLKERCTNVIKHGNMLLLCDKVEDIKYEEIEHVQIADQPEAVRELQEE